MKNDLKDLVHTWGWIDPPAYVIAQAERVLACQGKDILDVVVAYDLATREELDELSRHMPRNVHPLDFLSQRVKGLSSMRQQILATFNGMLFYEVPIEPDLLFHEMSQKAIAEHCKANRCVAFHHPANQHQMVIGFCDFDDLDKFEKAGRTERMENVLVVSMNLGDEEPMCVLMTAANLNAALGAATAGNVEGAHRNANRSYWAHNQAETDAQRVIAKIFDEAIDIRASDITFWPENDGTAHVVFRRNGRLILSQQHPKISFAHASEGIRFLMGKTKALSDGSILAVPVDGKLQYRGPSREVFMRHNYMPVNRVGSEFEMIVGSIRVFTMENVEINLESLRIHPDLVKEIRRVLKGNKGLILVVAPVNQGKSTTIGGIISEHVKQYGVFGAKRMSVEAPVERYQDGLISTNVENETLIPAYVRALFRQDLDFGFIGEVRDSFTAAAFARIGNSGHLCASTGHAEDAVSGITMVINYLRAEVKGSADALVIQPSDFVSKLQLVVAQRLVPELCQVCRIEHKLSEEELEDIALHEEREMHAPSRVEELRRASEEGRLFKKNVDKPVGECQCFKGIVGEMPINEWIPVSKRLRHAMSQMVQDNRFDYEKVSEGRVGSLYSSAIDLVLQGKVAIEDAVGL
jgi:type II secretory ATPase GspE/PulE/Tfp pilus assembly ATPase PilB-like protein